MKCAVFCCCYFRRDKHSNALCVSYCLCRKKCKLLFIIKKVNENATNRSRSNRLYRGSMLNLLIYSTSESDVCWASFISCIFMSCIFMSVIFSAPVVISRERCILDTKLLWDGNRKPYARCRMVSLSMTLSDPSPTFQGHGSFKRRVSPKRCILQTQLLYRT